MRPADDPTGIEPIPPRTQDESLWESKGHFLGLAGDLVLIGGVVDRLSGFDPACRKACTPVMTTHLSGSAIGGAGQIFVGTTDGIAVLDAACEGFCEPIAWLRSDEPGDPSSGYYFGMAPNSFEPHLVVGDQLVATVGWDGAAGSGVFESKLATFPVDRVSMCRPTWMGTLASGRTRAVESSGMVLSPVLDRLEAYRCVIDGCAREWQGRLHPESGGINWTGQPGFTEQHAIVVTTGCVCGSESATPKVAAFPVGCIDPTCQPDWWARIPKTRFTGGPTIDGDRVFVVAGAPGGLMPAVYAFPTDCLGRCEPIAEYAVPDPGSLVVDGPHVFVTSGARLLVFDRDCTGRCTPILSRRLPARAGPIELTREALLVASGSELLWFPRDTTVHLASPEASWSARRGIYRLDVIRDIVLIGTHSTTFAVPIAR